MKTPIFFIIAMLGFGGLSCEEGLVSGGSETKRDTLTGQWRIPKERVFDGGPGKDGIPSIDEPNFLDATQADYLSDNDLVLGIKIGDQVRAYPHPVMNWHEIVNDSFEDSHIAITYCPLTGTGIGWDRQILGKVTTFGVSGLLYNSNLIPYDRQTESNWSQMLNKGVHGTMIDSKARTYTLLETNWATWKKMYPDSRVLSTNTGFKRNYQHNPYGNYKEKPNLLFPVEPLDERLFSKERVLGIIRDGQAKTYRFKNFSDSTTIIGDTFLGKEFIIAGSQKQNLLVAFENRTLESNETDLQFAPVQDALPVIMKDSEGSLWNVFGEAVTGPNEGKKLKKAKSIIGFWFAWGAFYPNPAIYENNN